MQPSVSQTSCIKAKAVIYSTNNRIPQSPCDCKGFVCCFFVFFTMKLFSFFIGHLFNYLFIYLTIFYRRKLVSLHLFMAFFSVIKLIPNHYLPTFERFLHIDNSLIGRTSKLEHEIPLSSIVSSIDKNVNQ